MPSLSRMPSLVRVGSLTRMGSLGNALQSAKSGEFLDFLNEITARELQEERERAQGGGGDAGSDYEYGSMPPTPTTPLGTPGGSPVLGGHGQYGGMASAEPSPRGGDDATASGVANNPSNDLFQANEDVFVEALNTTKTNNVLLKDYFLSDERAGDIVYFPQDRLPWFEREKIRRDGRQDAGGKGGGVGRGGQGVWRRTWGINDPGAWPRGRRGTRGARPSPRGSRASSRAAAATPPQAQYSRASPSHPRGASGRVLSLRPVPGGGEGGGEGRCGGRKGGGGERRRNRQWRVGGGLVGGR